MGSVSIYLSDYSIKEITFSQSKWILFLSVCSPDLDKPVLTVHQTVGDVRGNYYQEKTVFLRCTVNSNPPARFIWKRGNKPIEQSKDNGVDIYEPLYTQVQDYHDFYCFYSFIFIKKKIK